VSPEAGQLLARTGPCRAKRGTSSELPSQTEATRAYRPVWPNNAYRGISAGASRPCSPDHSLIYERSYPLPMRAVLARPGHSASSRCRIASAPDARESRSTEAGKGSDPHQLLSAEGVIARIKLVSQVYPRGEARQEAALGRRGDARQW
jgi:hypothetical protein